MLVRMLAVVCVVLLPSLALAKDGKGSVTSSKTAAPTAHVQFRPLVPITFLQRPSGDLVGGAGVGARMALKWAVPRPVGGEGDVRAQVLSTWGPDLWQWGYTVGAHAGPRFQPPAAGFLFQFAILSGLEFNGDALNDDPTTSPGLTHFVGLPMLARLRLLIVELTGGVVPWWRVAGLPRTPVTWAQVPFAGFGDEMEIRAGVAVHLGIVAVRLSTTHRAASYGLATQVILGFSIGLPAKNAW